MSELPLPPKATYHGGFCSPTQGPTLRAYTKLLPQLGGTAQSPRAAPFSEICLEM